MSLELMIASVVKEALEEKFVNPYPVYANKIEMAKILGISPKQLLRLMVRQVLVEEVHYTRFSDGGHPMFAVKKVVEALKPAMTTLDELL